MATPYNDKQAGNLCKKLVYYEHSSGLCRLVAAAQSTAGPRGNRPTTLLVTLMRVYDMEYNPNSLCMCQQLGVYAVSPTQWSITFIIAGCSNPAKIPPAP